MCGETVNIAEPGQPGKVSDTLELMWNAIIAPPQDDHPNNCGTINEPMYCQLNVNVMFTSNEDAELPSDRGEAAYINRLLRQACGDKKNCDEPPFQIFVFSDEPVPEPPSIWLLTIGLVMLLIVSQNGYRKFLTLRETIRAAELGGDVMATVVAMRLTGRCIPV
jgi:hypothetical protein